MIICILFFPKTYEYRLPHHDRKCPFDPVQTNIFASPPYPYAPPFHTSNSLNICHRSLSMNTWSSCWNSMSYSTHSFSSERYSSMMTDEKKRLTRRSNPVLSQNHSRQTSSTSHSITFRALCMTLTDSSLSSVENVIEIRYFTSSLLCTSHRLHVLMKLSRTAWKG